MKDRIQQFIEYKGISPGDLSTALDVQRSNISHILNGRNKPGAAFIEKILLAYPDLNARWLLTGQGNMINEENASVGDNFKMDSNTIQPNSIKDSNKEEESLPVDKTGDSDRAKSQLSSTSESTSRIEKLLLLNSDGTFTIYNQTQ